MNIRRLAFYGTALLIVFGTAIATTYLCLEHFGYSRHAAPAGVSAAHAWAHQIGLNHEQEAKLEPLEKALQKDLSDLQIKLAQERIALCALMRQDFSDPKELDAYIRRVGALEAEQQKRVVQHLLTMRGLLTPDQKEKFFDAIMQGICQGCRTSTGNGKDMCGMCKLHTMK